MTGGRLLVVDDEPGFGEFVRKVGVKLGYEVAVTTNGRDFKRLYDAFGPTVVLLDVVMPEIDGVELVQWLADRNADAHLIVVTGYAPNYAVLTKKLAEARGLRSVATLTKPVKVADLRAALVPHDDS